MSEKKKEFLKSLAKKYYTQGDSYYAWVSKSKLWHFGYANDYTMQHGDGKDMILPDGVVEILMKSGHENRELLKLIDELQEKFDENGYDLTPVVKLMRVKEKTESVTKIWQEENRQLKERNKILEEAVKEVISIKNPFDRKKQYEQWAAAENVLDDLILTNKMQSALESLK